MAKRKLKINLAGQDRDIILTTPEDIIQYFGGVEATAERLALCRQAVSQWRRRGVIPEWVLTRIEVMTGGAFDAKSYWGKHYAG